MFKMKKNQIAIVTLLECKFLNRTFFLYTFEHHQNCRLIHLGFRKKIQIFGQTMMKIVLGLCRR